MAQKPLLEAVFNHLVLPAQITLNPTPTSDAPTKAPSKKRVEDDEKIIQEELGDRFSLACQTLSSLVPSEIEVWNAVSSALRATRQVNRDLMSVQTVLQALIHVRDSPDAESWVALYIACQNVSLLVHKDTKNQCIIFESFMTSAPNKDVLNAAAALRREFPDRSASVSFETFDTDSFRHDFATFLVQAVSDTFDQFVATGTKGGVIVTEERDVCNPALIDGMLMSVLEGVGDSVKVPRVKKHVRGDLILERAAIVWRRSPYWLTLRIMVERQIRTLREGNHRPYIKFLLATVHAKFLEDCYAILHPERVNVLIAKLARRLAKLEEERESSTGSTRELLDMFFQQTGPNFFSRVLQMASISISNAWSSFKQRTRRIVPRLNREVPLGDLRFELKGSVGYLRGLLNQTHSKAARKSYAANPAVKEAAILQIPRQAERQAKIDIEKLTESQRAAGKEQPDGACAALFWAMAETIEAAKTFCKGNSILMSRSLLSVFQHWVAMDKLVIEACPLLSQYRPPFDPRALDVLCLPSWEDMERVRAVQAYLAERTKKAISQDGWTFLDKPIASNAFPHQYYKSLQGSAVLGKLEEEIDEANEHMREAKIKEFDKTTEHYKDLLAKVQQEPCKCRWDRDGNMDITACAKCFHDRQRRRMQITVHENLLPEKENREPARAACYREITWRLLVLGDPTFKTSEKKASTVLENFRPVRDYLCQGDLRISDDGTARKTLTLGSVSKSFTGTHFRYIRMTSSSEDVLKPFGLSVGYWGSEAEVWATDLTDRAPSYEHLLGSWIPTSLEDPYGQVEKLAEDTYGPTSYEIAGSFTQCPYNMSIHEYSAYQRILSARARRWVVITVELGATNINFGSLTAMRFFNHMALQVGPDVHQEGIRGEVHGPFSDDAFCKQLHDQISRRLDSIQKNWREVCCASILVTFSLHLYQFCRAAFAEAAKGLLEKIRDILSGWIIVLRNELRSTEDPEVAEKASEHSLWAALLCRQTFSILSNNDAAGDTGLNGESLLHYLRASIALQENVRTDISRLSEPLRMLLERDMCEAFANRKFIYEIMDQDEYVTLEVAINETWPCGPHVRKYTNWKVTSSDAHRWVSAEVTSRGWSQMVHYNPTQGHLLVDHEPLGKLPLNMSQDMGIQELFGQRRLLTRPSPLPGMKYQLVALINGHELHFGEEKGGVIIQAWCGNCHLQFIPRHRLQPPDTDREVPSSLVEDCVHWLNLVTGELEMRRKPDIWIMSKFSTWKLNLHHMTIVRRRDPTKGKPGSFLVKPQSQVAQAILSVFAGFEYGDKLTIYSVNDVIHVEMKRLDLDFSVTKGGWLRCKQLGAFVSQNQDLGALYGLESGIVLDDANNRERRTLILPFGKLSWRRRGMHVSVHVQNDGQYTRFSINNVLGRLECAPDPWILYLKATLHALTSFPLPDALTGRTGTEEALHCLASAQSQPWKPLRPGAIRMLLGLRSLSPIRNWYPTDRRVCQSVTWDQHLTMTVQHEGIAPLVDRILIQSRCLEAFETEQPEEKSPMALVEIREDGIGHLELRGLLRRQSYEHHCPVTESLIPEDVVHGTTFSPRDLAMGHDFQSQISRVFSAVRTLRQDPKTLNQRLLRLESLKTLYVEHENEDLGETGHFVLGFKEKLSASDLQSQLDLSPLRSLGPAIETCRHVDGTSAYEVAFSIGLMAFNWNVSDFFLQWLVAIAINPELRAVKPPEHEAFQRFRPSDQPTKQMFMQLILESQSTEGEAIEFRARNKRRRYYYSIEEAVADRKGREAEKIASLLVQKWPLSDDESLSSLVFGEKCEYLDLDVALAALREGLERNRLNADLTQYFDELLTVAKSLRGRSGPRDFGIFCHEPAKLADTIPTPRRVYYLPRLKGDLSMKTCDNEALKSELALGRWTGGAMALSPDGSDADEPEVQIPPELAQLSDLVEGFAESTNATRREYGRDLRQSLNALAKCQSRASNTVIETPSKTDTCIARQDIEIMASRSLAAIKAVLSFGEVGLPWLHFGNLWPATTAVTVLELLRTDYSRVLSDELRTAVVSFGILVTHFQRLLRMLDAHGKGYGDSYGIKRLMEEVRNPGHQNWNPEEHPEWLLLEIDSNIMIRPSQVEVAWSIISPPSGANSVLQLNMGQGKTSCIIPMALIALANKKQLCRIIVPKALLLQTAQVIQRRAGGLVGRVVRHIPFSRRTPTTKRLIETFERLHTEILSSRGVMLCIPEHILSFKLNGLQKLADGCLKDSEQMITVQNWLDESCRDILDESDFTLSTKTQLIYPSGAQAAVDGHPQRWKVAQDLLARIVCHIEELVQRFNGDVLVVARPQGYPIMHFLDERVENALNELLIGDACNGRLAHLEFKDSMGPGEMAIMSDFLSGENVPAYKLENVLGFLADEQFGPKNLILLRGLISTRIILLCLKKRWNVQYGLHPGRVPMAVPFEAKGIPSQTAEYGHPDTAIVLTCLAFYHTGLSRDQLTTSLRHIIQSPDPSNAYESWIQGCHHLPNSLRHWDAINMEDDGQIGDLWKYLRFDRIVLNHHMNTFVFPAHAKQFDVKLQASGWDIPLFRNIKKRVGGGVDQSEVYRPLTTGFSGTNDNKRMLPDTIEQADLHSLQQTNAEVLNYLLADRNRRCFRAADLEGRPLTEDGLLMTLNNLGIRVLIDSGAYILEKSNKDVASAWLRIDPEAQGAVYFDKNSQAFVMTRFQRLPMPLLASPYADDLSECVVYIDEAHTRGTDLKLPDSARGALTLGLGQTKDHTVQGAMRLRQLGTTQSIAFIAPPEVWRSILDLRPTPVPGRPLTSVDIVRWLLEQSCKANEQLMSLHVAQGADFCHRTNALWQRKLLFDPSFNADRRNLLKVVLQKEEQTLEELYGLRAVVDHDRDSALPKTTFPQLKKVITSLTQKKLVLAAATRTARGSLLFASVEQEQEKEREVEFEVEQVRQRQKPHRLQACVFPGLNPEIHRFVATGVLENKYRIHALDYIGRTKIGAKYGVKKSTSTLFVSREFERTVEFAATLVEDGIRRPVEWILWCPKTQTALVVIPEEAELLMHMLWTQEDPKVWLLSYSAPVTRFMTTFSTLQYLTIPAMRKEMRIPGWLRIEVGVLAGRLYFDWEEYRPLLAWLGLLKEPHGELTHGLKLGIRHPRKFLSEWLAHCRQTHDITNTPMGYICQRQELKMSHSFFDVATVRDIDSGHISTSERVALEDGGDDLMSDCSDQTDSDEVDDHDEDEMEPGDGDLNKGEEVNRDEGSLDVDDDEEVWD